MNGIEGRSNKAYRWHIQCTMLLAACLLAACTSGRGAVPMDAPSEAARHRAALATVVIANATEAPLTIAFQSAIPPLQEVTIGRAAGGARARMAPVPAGEPIILIARRLDGSELRLGARSFPPDAEWTWEISQAATFTIPDRAN